MQDKFPEVASRTSPAFSGLFQCDKAAGAEIPPVRAIIPYRGYQESLRVAVRRRNLARMLTEYWYGEDRVVRAIENDLVDGRYAIMSELIPCALPCDLDRSHGFFIDPARRFDNVGLSPHQVEPRLWIRLTRRLARPIPRRGDAGRRVAQ